MGNTTSSTAEPRSRRARPSSWAPSLMHRPTQLDTAMHRSTQLDADMHTHTQSEAGDVPAPLGPGRPSASQRTNLFRRFSSLHGGRHDAGPSPPTLAPTSTSTSTSTSASAFTPSRQPRPPRPRSRLMRARTSLSDSVTGLLHGRPSISSRTTEPVPPRAAREPRDLAGPFLPRLHVPDLDMAGDFDRLLSTEPGHDRDDPQRPRLLAPSSPRREGRHMSMLPAQRRLRNMIAPSRRRRSLWHDDDHLEDMERLRRGEDQADVLSRLLSLAAAATAASLVGEDHQAATRDGTFDTFLQSLQNGSIASALRGNDGSDGGDGTPGAAAPLNFFRMFRFGTSVANTRSNGASDAHDGDDDGEGRMVPIIIVGIRSINPGSGAGSDDGNIPPFIDALSSFPTPPTTSGDSNEHLVQPPQNGTRFSHRRRASMGGFNFPSNYDSQRHHRGNTNDRSRPWSSRTDSPAGGPVPPPPTPATILGLSAEASGATTPATSTSPPSPIIQPAAPSRRSSFVRRPTGATLESTAEEPQTQHRSPRQRRMSESDFTRYGHGAQRRNGVVEPDNNPGEGSRSWIIYVLGGSYPENHPILTTPSLFTDSPTYEDMMLLSSILGPAKPPVASEEDVAAAAGIYTIRTVAGTLIAEAVDGEETIDLASDARCLVCLCDFEAEEEARKLVKCEHLFHKICIDQWLTTGRNSCPLCRGQGVDETPADPAEVVA